MGTEPATSQLESQSLTAAPRVPVLSLNFQLHQLTLLINDEFLVENSNQIPYYLQNI